MNESVEQFIKIIIAVIIPNIGGWFGARFVFKNIDWYDSLKQPLFNPPKWLFGPAWTLFYSCIGFASYLVYDNLNATGNGFDKTAITAITLYVVQLIFNWLWTPIFFGAHSLTYVRIFYFVSTTMLITTQLLITISKIN